MIWEKSFKPQASSTLLPCYSLKQPDIFLASALVLKTCGSFMGHCPMAASPSAGSQA